MNKCVFVKKFELHNAHVMSVLYLQSIFTQIPLSKYIKFLSFFYLLTNFQVKDEMHNINKMCIQQTIFFLIWYENDSLKQKTKKYNTFYNLLKKLDRYV